MKAASLGLLVLVVAVTLAATSGGPGWRMKADYVEACLYDYLGAMKKAGLGDRTCHNRCAEVSTMLRFHGINVSIQVKYTKKIVRAYRDDELQKLFAAADLEEHLLFSYFLATGAREQEIQF